MIEDNIENKNENDTVSPINEKKRSKKKISRKYKSNKKNISLTKNKQNILQIHENKLQELEDIESRLEVIDNQIKSFRNKLKKLENEKSLMYLNKQDTFEISKEILALSNKINEMYENRKTVESGQDVIDYLLESTPIINKYIELQEKELEFHSNTTQSSSDFEGGVSPVFTENDLLENPVGLHLNSFYNTSGLLNDIHIQKNLLSEDYKKKFDENYVSTDNMQSRNLNICKNCEVEMETSCRYSVCPECGYCQEDVCFEDQPSYKELQNYSIRPQFTYDKMSHLEEWLRRFQAKENRSIPQEILDKVIYEAKKERMTDFNLLTEDKVKKYLKKLNLNQYYDNIIGIINRINGRPPFRLTNEIEEKIKIMFQQIQEPFERHKPKNRRNFLSYSYTLHKFFQILHLPEFAKYFPLLKSDDKLRQQDDIFRKIVLDMSKLDNTVDWIFYPSV